MSSSKQQENNDRKEGEEDAIEHTRLLQQQQAFQQFMLQRQSTSKKKSKGSTEKPPTPNPPIRRGDSSAQQQPQQQHESHYYQQQQQQQYQRKLASIVKAFAGTLQRDWLEVDETLGNVMSSVAHLRHRIALEQRQVVLQLEQTSNQQYNNHNQDDDKEEEEDDWKTWGFHEHGRDAGVALTLADVHMALSRDLLQHESVCSTARKLLASLAQTQDALGRRLDEMMQFEMNHGGGGVVVVGGEIHEADGSATTTTSSSSSKCAAVVASCQQIYSSLALELFRKQRLVHQVLETVHDGMLFTNVSRKDDGTVGDGKNAVQFNFVEESKTFTTKEEDPMRVAERCVQHWPLTRQSYWSQPVWEEVKGWL